MPRPTRQRKKAAKTAAKTAAPAKTPAPSKSVEEWYTLAEAIRRTNDIFERNVGQDDKLALDAAKEMNRLHDLYRQIQEARITGETTTEHPAEAELDAIAEHLRPLGLSDEDTPLAELARLAAMVVMSAPAKP